MGGGEKSENGGLTQNAGLKSSSNKREEKRESKGGGGGGGGGARRYVPPHLRNKQKTDHGGKE
eukprot:CAMPEP_0119148328 /NCGR_PEP_ID=MMETSP1310-20130426/41674_1 /TAXON_ID=464262 /ORGANISM="Genus nov. species nov., Strain RCC2339" /LENGTH=62 /DNA_ID=CAMNT_0007140357 /DNA_START=77 /DNA_END=262 /DNA_ORIENTATION=-